MCKVRTIVFNMNFLYTNNQVIKRITFGYKLHRKTRVIIRFNSQRYCFQHLKKIVGEVEEDLN